MNKNEMEIIKSLRWSLDEWLAQGFFLIISRGNERKKEEKCTFIENIVIIVEKS